MIGEVENTKIEFKIKPFQLEYAQEITLKPKNKEAYKTLIEKFNRRNDKKAFLYLKATLTETSSMVRFMTNPFSFSNSNEFQNSEGNRFEVRILNNGYYFNYDGTFEESVFIDEGLGDKNDVYACKLSDDKDIIDIKKLDIKYLKFIENASTAFAESSFPYLEINDINLSREMFSIASIHHNYPNETAFATKKEEAINFRAKTLEQRNKTKMQIAISAVINALIGGKDYSNGAHNWDGKEQAQYPVTDDRIRDLDEKYIIHMNTRGWKILDDHYDKWKKAIGSSFKAPKIKYSPSGVNKGKITYESTAVWGRTIFWKDVNYIEVKK